jgi:hypothetical protein
MDAEHLTRGAFDAIDRLAIAAVWGVARLEYRLANLSALHERDRGRRALGQQGPRRAAHEQQHERSPATAYHRHRGTLDRRGWSHQ